MFELGIYQSTLEELVDNPLALSRPESRAFGLFVAHQLQTINDSYATGASFSTIVATLSGVIPSDEIDIDRSLRKPLTNAISTKWPLARRQAFLFGMLTAQVAYNAAVLKDPSSDTSFREALASLPAYAGMSSRVQADLKALRDVSYAAKGGDWSPINAAASRAVIDMSVTP